MKYILKLIRWKNLLIVAISMYAVWFFVNAQFFAAKERILNGWFLFGLIISTVLIAAAGYIINDYFDVKIDAINHPETLIVSNKVSRRTALYLHNTFNFIGLGIIAWIAYSIQQYSLILIPITTITMLWFYSTHFKRMAVIGNVIVALLTALSTLQLFLFEPGFYPMIISGMEVSGGKNNPVLLIVGISSLAFLLNWMREIIKDMEDLKGDAEQGCRTYPIVHGLQSASRFVVSIGWVTVLLLAFAAFYFFKNGRVGDACLLLLVPVFGLIVVNITIPKYSTKDHYARISKYLKWIMVLGLLLLFFLAK